MKENREEDLVEVDLILEEEVDMAKTDFLNLEELK